jgi:heat shock protein HtpX
MAAMFVYWILTFLVLGLSRLREYSADRASVTNVEDGARKLSEALAKIVTSTSRIRLTRGAMGGTSGVSGFKSLFIEDPDASMNEQIALSRAMGASSDQRLVDEVLRRKITTADRIAELFSTHPNIVKRLRALQSI